MNVVNSIARIPIKGYIGLLKLTIVKSKGRSPIQSSTAKKLTNYLLVSSRVDLMMIYVIIVRCGVFHSIPESLLLFSKAE